MFSVPFLIELENVAYEMSLGSIMSDIFVRATKNREFKRGIKDTAH